MAGSSPAWYAAALPLPSKAGKLFGGLARGSVDDGGAGGFGLEQVDDEGIAARLRELDDLDGEVVPAEAVDEECGIAEPELRDDVMLHRWVWQSR